MKKKTDPIISILVTLFLLSLTYAGYLSYKSIDYQILDKLESTPLNLPELPATPQTLPPRSSTN